jgi:hypothetical protein
LEVRSHLFILAKNSTAPLRISLGMSAAYIPRGVLRENAEGDEWGVTADVLADVAALAARQGTPTLFVLMPERYQVDMDIFRSHVSAYGLEAHEVDLAQPNRRLVEELTARDLEVIDVLPAFQQQQGMGPRALYGSVDPHLSARGHEVLFELLRPRLGELLWSD